MLDLIRLCCLFQPYPAARFCQHCCHEQLNSQLITTWLETFIFSSDGVPREPPKKHLDFWDLILLLWAEMTHHHLNNDLFHHERRQPSAALRAMTQPKSS
jgi:hypothetical protein